MITQFVLCCDDCKKLYNISEGQNNKSATFAFNHRNHNVRLETFCSSLDNADNGYYDYTDVTNPKTEE